MGSSALICLAWAAMEPASTEHFTEALNHQKNQ